jgi:hypothetical protein
LNSKLRAPTDDQSAINGVPLRVNFELVVKQGVLNKKGSILRLYNNECIFYLEKRQENHSLLGSSGGPFLKYGPKKKALSHCIDLGGGKV